MNSDEMARPAASQSGSRRRRRSWIGHSSMASQIPTTMGRITMAAMRSAPHATTTPTAISEAVRSRSHPLALRDVFVEAMACSLRCVASA